MAKNNNLREFRTKKLMTQKQLSEKTGVCSGTISAIENGHTNPMDVTRRRLAKFFQRPSADIFPVLRPTNSLNRLREVRLASGMTQRALAKKSGISTVTISFIESKEGHKPTKETKRQLAEALRTSVKGIFTRRKA